MNKSSGRHDFQIGLAMALMNFAIEIDIDKVTGKKPSWMCQTLPEPCKCNMCYFCINGKTDGISHKRKHQVVTTQYACGTTVTDKTCSIERVPIPPSKRGYCRMCYRGIPATPKLSTAQKKKMCNYSRLGCTLCEEPICDDCWEKGYDRHVGKNTE